MEHFRNLRKAVAKGLFKEFPCQGYLEDLISEAVVLESPYPSYASIESFGLGYEGLMSYMSFFYDRGAAAGKVLPISSPVAIEDEDSVVGLQNSDSGSLYAVAYKHGEPGMAMVGDLSLAFNGHEVTGWIPKFFFAGFVFPGRIIPVPEAVKNLAGTDLVNSVSTASEQLAYLERSGIGSPLFLGYSDDTSW